MDFMNEIKTTLNEDFNVSKTENGALGFKTTGTQLLDLNFATSSLRGATDKEIINKFVGAFYENKLLALKWLFFARDAREGMGERNLFRVVLRELANTHVDIVMAIIPLVPVYGRFDDLLILLDSNVHKGVVDLIKAQLSTDITNQVNGNPISLLAKWLPSENTSSKETIRNAKTLIRELGLTSKQYRKTLSTLRGYLNIVETNMCAKNWDDINYSQVPSQANIKYNAAFLRNDEERRRDFLSKLTSGDKTVKINASTLFPSDIVARYNSSRLVDDTLEALWKALPDNVTGNGNVLVVGDGSGSMTATVSGSITRLDIANALEIYFSEKLSEPFKDKYISFSKVPVFVDLSQAKNLKEKIAIARHYNKVENTNIEAVFDLILATSVNAKVPQSEIPTVLIVSDMEFDQGTTVHADQKLFANIAEKFAQKGYILPKLVFWNVASSTNTIPIKTNKAGVILVSGFSTATASMVFSNKTDPFEALVDTLNTERYDAVEKAVIDLL